MFTVTETAKIEIAGVLSENRETYIRVAVQGGGCSGFSYVFDFAKNSEYSFDRALSGAHRQ
jgi:Fe-S cluster assembly iron-binding protein IscA